MPRRLQWCLLLLVALLGCAHQGATPVQPEEVPRAAVRSDPISQTDAVVAFARVYGYVRFFHPTDRAASADWQRIAAQGAAYVRPARTVGELADRLEAIFGPYGAGLSIWVGEEPPPPVRPRPRPAEGYVYWQYQGYVGTPVSLYRPPYERVRVGADERGRRRFSEMPEPGVAVDATLLGAIHVRVPVLLSAKEAAAQGGMPAPLDPEIGAMVADREGFRSLDVRQGAVVEVWNILRHFYPYQAEVPLDWDAELRSALEDAVDDASRQDVIDTLGRLVHALGDGHGEVGHPRSGRRALPFRVEVIDGRAVVTASDDPRLRVGDVVLAIDGEPMLERISRMERTLSGSPQWRRHKAAAWLGTMGPRGERARIAIERRGDRREVEAIYEAANVPPLERGAPFARHPDGVLYVDLTRIDADELRALLPELALAPGVVFDMRGYPDNVHFIIDHLLLDAEDALWLHVPKIIAPDGDVAAWHQIGWHRRPAEPRIVAPVAFLVSPAAISYAESILGYVEAHGLGTLIGTASAGANGDIVRVDTLAGFYVVFTGMRVTRHDGSRFHQDGIRPELEVRRTLAGVAAGRDEVLEAALEHVRGSPGRQLANTDAGAVGPASP